jgi:ribosomal-protein-alanine N-acetyltransferase
MSEADLLQACAAEAPAAEVQFEPLYAPRLDTVLEIEQRAYAHPWSRTNFLDALQSGYQAQMLVADATVLGYFVVMQGVDEAHLLNITVAPQYQRQGWAKLMLQAVALWARGQNLGWLWLEVRVGNVPAMALYEGQGFRRVGLRRQYYPAQGGQREDAVVMNLALSHQDNNQADDQEVNQEDNQDDPHAS